MGEAVELERHFCCEALDVGLMGMNADLMAQYIDFVADRLLVALRCEKLYNTRNPFDWMETISLQVSLTAAPIRQGTGKADCESNGAWQSRKGWVATGGAGGGGDGGRWCQQSSLSKLIAHGRSSLRVRHGMLSTLLLKRMADKKQDVADPEM